MKKLALFFTFFVSVLFFPLHVHAGSFAFSAESLQSISNGFSQLEYVSYGAEGLLPISQSQNTSLSDISTFISGKSTYTTNLTNNDIVSSSSLDDVPYDLYEVISTWDFCGSDGLKIFDISNIRYVTFDNGYYSGEAFIDENGDILYRYIDGIGSGPDGQLCNIRQGGSEMTKADFYTMYQNAGQHIGSSNYCFNVSSPSSVGTSSYYVAWGLSNRGLAESFYIANQYIQGVIVPIASNGGAITSWYTNNPDLIHHETLMGDMNTKNIQSGTWTYNGATYRYRVSAYSGLIDIGSYQSLVSFNDWVAGDHSSAVFGRIGYYFDGDFLVDKTITFGSTSKSGTIDIGQTIGLDSVKDLSDSYAETPWGVNKSYDPADDDDGWAISLDIPFADDIVIPIPIPGEGEDEEEGNPAIDDELPIIVPSDIPDLPIVNGLQNRFPFSIPWDIKNLLKGLRSRPVAPSFHISWYIQPLNYTWEFDIDLSVFNTQAELFRNCFLILFVIGLAVFSYRHFFGQ